MPLSPEAYSTLVDLASKARTMVERLAQTGSGNYTGQVEVYQAAWNDAEAVIKSVPGTSFSQLVEDGKYGAYTAGTLAQLLPADHPPPARAYQIPTWYSQNRAVVEAMGSYEAPAPDISTAFVPPSPDAVDIERDYVPDIVMAQDTHDQLLDPWVPTDYIPPTVESSFSPPEARVITIPAEEQYADSGPLISAAIPDTISHAEITSEESYTSDASLIQNAPGSPVVVVSAGGQPIVQMDPDVITDDGHIASYEEPVVSGPEIEVIGRKPAGGIGLVAGIAATAIGGGFLWWMLSRKGAARPRRAHA